VPARKALCSLKGRLVEKGVAEAPHEGMLFFYALMLNQAVA
jgi:hypothetical protein